MDGWMEIGMEMGNDCGTSVCQLVDRFLFAFFKENTENEGPLCEPG